jgi:HEAT repeat protein
MENWKEGDFAPTTLQGLILGTEADLAVANQVLVDQDASGSVELIEALDEFYEPSARHADLLIRAYATSDSKSVRSKALRLLTIPERRDPKIFPTLLAAANDADWITQIRAIEALVEFPAEQDQIVPVLIPLIDAEVPNVEGKAVKALTAFPDKADAIVPALADFLRVAGRPNRDFALRALVSFRNRADLVEPVLRDMLDSDSPSIRADAADALEQLEQTEAVD